MYFLLAGVVEKFHYLKAGLAIVLTFIGVKMLVVAVDVHIPIGVSLTFVAVVLLGSVAASLVWTKDAERNLEVDLPEYFDPTPDDAQVEDLEPAGQKDDAPRSDQQAMGNVEREPESSSRR